MAEDTSMLKMEFLSQAMKRLERGTIADDHNRAEGVESLEFLEGIGQWDEAEIKRRTMSKRPMMKVNLLPKYVDQVVGDMRQNKVRIKIRPASPDANVHIATIRQGMIADIEYKSNAPWIYDQAGESVVGCGYGAWRVLHRYTEENPFLQEIYMELLPNPFCVVWDPASKDPMKMDANWCFIVEKVNREEFEEQYPDSDMPSASLIPSMPQGTTYDRWWDDDTVTVAEYYVVKKEKVTMCLMDDGKILEKGVAEKKIKQWKEAEEAGEVSVVPSILKEREVEKRRIRHYTITANDILSEGGLEGEAVPGKYIPIISISGKERNIQGKKYIRGMIKDAKDPQRLVNYWNTSAAETIALAPKAPWLGTAKQFEGYENDYATANTENLPYLKYNPDVTETGQLIPPPQRQVHANPPMGILSEIERAERNIEGTVGMSNRDTMAAGPERTGLAVINAKMPSDVGSFVFIDNLYRGVTYTGRVINSMIPEIMDTERDVRVRGFDDSESVVPINTTVGEAVKKIEGNPAMYKGFDVEALRQQDQNARFNDIGVGEYEVVSDIGPSFATERQISSQMMLGLSQTNPKLFNLCGDLIVGNMDLLYSEEAASRLRKTLPTGLVPQKEGEEPLPPSPPTPEQIVALKKIEVEDKRIEVQKLRYLREISMSKGEMKRIVLDMMEKIFGEDETEIEMGMKGGDGSASEE